jgi:hypothetical protein
MLVQHQQEQQLPVAAAAAGVLMKSLLLLIQPQWVVCFLAPQQLRQQTCLLVLAVV